MQQKIFLKANKKENTFIEYTEALNKIFCYIFQLLSNDFFWKFFPRQRLHFEGAHLIFPEKGFANVLTSA